MTDDEQMNVPIEFKGRHDQISERMQEHATKKLQKLGRYNDQFVRVEVIADNPHEHPEVELIVHMRSGAPMVAKQRGDTFANACDELIEKMEKQLKREKEKRTHHKGTGPEKGEGGGSDRESGEETYEDVVRKTMRG